MSEPTQTPRTDAMIASVQGGRFSDGSGDGITHEEDYYDKSRDLCRTLEIELTTERAAREQVCLELEQVRKELEKCRNERR